MEELISQCDGVPISVYSVRTVGGCESDRKAGLLSHSNSGEFFIFLLPSSLVGQKLDQIVVLFSLCKYVFCVTLIICTNLITVTQ